MSLLSWQRSEVFLLLFFTITHATDPRSTFLKPLYSSPFDPHIEPTFIKHAYHHSHRFPPHPGQAGLLGVRRSNKHSSTSLHLDRLLYCPSCSLYNAQQAIHPLRTNPWPHRMAGPTGPSFQDDRNPALHQPNQDCSTFISPYRGESHDTWEGHQRQRENSEEYLSSLLWPQDSNFSASAGSYLFWRSARSIFWLSGWV